MYAWCSVVSRVQLFATLWTVAHQLLCSWDFPGKNTGVGCHFLLQGNLPDPGIKSMFPETPALAGGFFTISATWEARLSSLLLLSTSVVSDSGRPYGL